MSINDRIKQLRKSLNLSQTDFGKKLGVSRDVINNLDRSAVDPKPLMLDHICSVYNVNPDWLMHGTGEMFLERDSGDEIAEFLSSILDDDDASIRKRFILALSKFDGDDWATVEKFLDNFSKTEKDGE
jgi:transcriptional regulator with XRE-family HTH domain